MRGVVVVVACLLAGGCGGTVTFEESALSELSKTSFRTLPADFGKEVYESQVFADLDGLTYDEAWTATLEWAIQHGVVVRASRQTGIIAVMNGMLVTPHYESTVAVSQISASAPAMIGLRPNGMGGVRVYLAWNEELLNARSSPGAWKLEDSSRQAMTMRFFRELVVCSLWQYKWTYLKSAEAQ